MLKLVWVEPLPSGAIANTRYSPGLAVCENETLNDPAEFTAVFKLTGDPFGGVIVIETEGSALNGTVSPSIFTTAPIVADCGLACASIGRVLLCCEVCPPMGRADISTINATRWTPRIIVVLFRIRRHKLEAGLL